MSPLAVHGWIRPAAADNFFKSDFARKHLVNLVGLLFSPLFVGCVLVQQIQLILGVYILPEITSDV